MVLNGFTKPWYLFAKELWHEINFLVGKDFVMISSKGIFKRNLCMGVSTRVLMSTFPLQVMKGMARAIPKKFQVEM